MCLMGGTEAGKKFQTPGGPPSRSVSQRNGIWLLGRAVALRQTDKFRFPPEGATYTSELVLCVSWVVLKQEKNSKHPVGRAPFKLIHVVEVWLLAFHYSIGFI